MLREGIGPNGIIPNSTFDVILKEFEGFDLIRIKKRRALFSMLYSLFILPWRINWKKYDFCIMLAANRRVFCRYPIFTIAVVHDLSQYHVPVKYDRFRMFYIKKVLPHYVRKAQSIVAISESTRSDLIKYWHIPEEKINGCVLLVGGKQANRFTKLRDGDQVMLMPPVAGG